MTSNLTSQGDCTRIVVACPKSVGVAQSFLASLDGYEFYLNSSNNLQLDVINVRQLGLSAAYQFVAWDWHALAFTADDTGNRADSYIDSWREGDNVVSGTTWSATSATTTDVGGRGGLGQYFDGYIAEIVAYNRVLSSMELNSILNGLRTKYALPQTATPVYTTPDQVANLYAWYKADAITGVSNGSILSSWPQSAGPVALTPWEGWEPIYVTNVTNGKPAVRFDGNNDWLMASGINLTGTEVTAIIACNRVPESRDGPGSVRTFSRLLSMTPVSGVDETLDTAVCIRPDNGVTQLWSSPRNGKQPKANEMIPNEWHVVAGRWSSATGQMYINGNPGPTVASTATSFAATQMALGNNATGITTSAWYWGDIAEVAIYNRSLSNAEIKSVSDGLIAKYAIDTHPGPPLVAVDAATNIGTWDTQISAVFFWLDPITTALRNRVAYWNPPAIRLPLHDYPTGGMPYISGVWDFTQLDSYVTTWRQVCAEPVLFDFFWVPQSLTVDPSNPATWVAIGDFMERVVRYYNLGSMVTQGGSTITNPYGTDNRITYWEIFNEPNITSSQFYGTAQQYADFFAYVAPRLKAVDPTIKLIGPVASSDYVDAVMACSSPPDIISTHCYGGGNYDYDYVLATSQRWPNTVAYNQKSCSDSAGSKDVWWTETNIDFTTEDDPAGRPWKGFGQAWNAENFRVGGLFYRVKLAQTWALTQVPQYGLIDRIDGTTYVAYWRNILLNRYFPRGGTILSVTQTGPQDVHVLAVRKPSGVISIMVINLRYNSITDNDGSGVPTTVTLNLSNITPTSVTCQQLDDTSSAASEPSVQTLTTSSTISVSFPGYGVAFLSVTS